MAKCRLQRAVGIELTLQPLADVGCCSSIVKAESHCVSKQTSRWQLTGMLRSGHLDVHNTLQNPGIILNVHDMATDINVVTYIGSW